MQKHLIDFAVAVTAYRNDFVRVRVEQFHCALGVIVLWHAVSRTMIESITQKEDCLGGIFFRPLEKSLQGFWTAMNVGKNHQSCHDEASKDI
jgi:hypothetical protein